MRREPKRLQDPWSSLIYQEPFLVCYLEQLGRWGGIGSWKQRERRNDSTGGSWSKMISKPVFLLPAPFEGVNTGGRDRIFQYERIRTLPCFLDNNGNSTDSNINNEKSLCYGHVIGPGGGLSPFHTWSMEPSQQPSGADISPMSERRKWKHREFEIHFLRPLARKCCLAWFQAQKEWSRVHALNLKAPLFLGHDRRLYSFEAYYEPKSVLSVLQILSHLILKSPMT